MTACAACPCDDPGRCPGAAGWATLCGIARRGSQAGRDHVRGLAGEGPEADPKGTYPLAATLAALTLVKRCPHRDERADCGCGGMATCGLGKGKDGQVNLADCTSCVAGPG